MGFEPKLLSSDPMLWTLDQGPFSLRLDPWFEGVGKGEEERVLGDAQNQRHHGRRTTGLGLACERVSMGGERE